MKIRIREGNDFDVVWAITRAGQPEDLSTATSMKLTLVVYGLAIEHSLFTVADNLLSINIPKEVATTKGDYRLVFEYTLPDAGQPDGDLKCKTDVVPFRIVPFSADADDVYTVNTSSDVLIGFKGNKGDDGDDAYQIWLDLGNVGTYEDFIAYLRQPAVDAGASISELEGEIQVSEGLRVSAETARVNAEGDATKGRVKAENERVAAEGERAAAETARANAEGDETKGRVKAENERVQAESERAQAETARVNAEGDATKGRVKAENERVTAEGERAQAFAQMMGEADDKIGEMDTTLSTYDGRVTQVESDISQLAGDVTVYNISEKHPLPAGEYRVMSSATVNLVPSEVRKRGMMIIIQVSAISSETYQFRGEDLSTQWSSMTYWIKNANVSDIINSQAFINLDIIAPRTPGTYHTLSSAISNVPVVNRRVGTIITWQNDATNAKIYQFMGSDPVNHWSSASYWTNIVNGRDLLPLQNQINSAKTESLYHSIASDLRALQGANLYNPKYDISDLTLRNDNGLTVTSVGSKISNYIEIKDTKRYILSGFMYDLGFSRVAVFYDKYGTILPTTWGTPKQYSLSSVDGDTIPPERTYYILAPESEVPVDWKTDGKATLPIPLGSVYIRFNTKVGVTNPTFLLEQKDTDLPSKYEPFLLKFNPSVTNLFNINKITLNQYLQSTNGTVRGLSPINGLSFAISDYIPVIGGSYYQIDGATTQNPLGDERATVFYDRQGQLLKPLDINGIESTSYQRASLNGVFMVPFNAVMMRFNCLYYEIIENISTLQFLTTASSSNDFIPYGYNRVVYPVIENREVSNNDIMLKYGDSYKGISIQDLMLGLSQVETDGIYQIIDYVTSAIQRTHYLELMRVNTQTIPVMANGMICENENGELLYVKNGITKKIQLI